MKRAEIEEWVDTTAKLAFSRSRGPGGQNVNKVNTKVTAALPLGEGSPLDDSQRDRITSRYPKRINSEGELFVHSQRGRTQLENRKLALDKLTALISTALAPERKRRPTTPSRASNERRLLRKRAAAEKKRHRTWRRFEE